jgi:hypothetical protein
MHSSAVELFSQEAVTRGLRDVEAKRRLLAAHRRGDDVDDYPVEWPPDPSCVGCGFNSFEERTTAHIDNCPVLRALAAPFADHPDYDPSWSPS